MKRIDMTERMENAIDLAAKCWDKAIRVEPDFVVEYLSCAEELLTQKPKVMGDEFRAYCLDRKLYRPSTLHHNVWVSGVTVLHSIGWIQPLGKVIPDQLNTQPRSPSQKNAPLVERGFSVVPQRRILSDGYM